jgi:hypothetical protein
MAVSTDIGRVIESPNVSETDSCRLSQVGYADACAEQKRWQLLVFALGCAFGLTLIAGIALVAIGSDTRGAGIVAFAGTAASGAAIAWMVKQRNDASTEKEKALELVSKYCRDPEKTANALEQGADPAKIVVPVA